MAFVFHTFVTGRAIWNVFAAACSAYIAGLRWVAFVLLGTFVFHTVVTGCTIWNVLVAACSAYIAGLRRAALIA